MTCPRCGGKTEKEWGGIAPQIVCTKCGNISDSYRSNWPTNDIVISAINRVWYTLGVESAPIQPFFETVRQTLHVSKLRVSKKELLKNGYVVENGLLRRNKQ